MLQSSLILCGTLQAINMSNLDSLRGKHMEKSGKKSPEADETTSLVSTASSEQRRNVEDMEDGKKPTFVSEQMSDDEKKLFWWWVCMWGMAISTVVSIICFAVLEWRSITGAKASKTWKAAAIVGAFHLLYGCFVRTSMSVIKHVWMKSIGFSQAEILAVYGTATLNLTEILAKYNSRQVGICDGVSRKGCHLSHHVGVMLLWKYIVMPHGGQVIFLSCAAREIVALGIWIFLRRRSYYYLNYIFWGSCVRVKDGYMRRENLIVGCFGAGSTKLIMLLVWQVHFLQIYPVSTHADVLLILMIPFTVGDAMAEIVGVIFGTHKFSVYGFGEINVKSVEGCCGMFVFTFVPICGLLFLQGYWWLWYVMALVIAIVTTLLETWSPRSTDNITIVFGTMVILHFFQPYLF